MDIYERLTSLSEVKYAHFSASLIPNIDKELVIGVRIPALRALAKEMFFDRDRFLHDLPHKYFEENNLHALIIAEIKDFDECVAEVDAFLPYIDNWATCDSLRPKVFAKNKQKLLLFIMRWLASDRVYTVRFAIEMLMVHYLEEDYSPEYPKLVAALRTDEYYLNMMIGWYFATALAKRWDDAIPFIEGDFLSPDARKMAIRKGIDSLAISHDRKVWLRSIR